MKIFSIIKNPYAQGDFVLYLKDNYSDDGKVTPAVNTDALTHTKSGLPMLQIEFWRNERFQEYFWHGECLSYVQDDDLDLVKRKNHWPEFLEVYNS